VLGVAAAAAGCTPRQAAHIAAYHSVSGPASAAVRLLGLDPIAVSALVARLAPEIDATAATATADATATGAIGGEALPFPSAPNLDLLAEIHATAEVRLFES
jgi:urease accessory protein